MGEAGQTSHFAFPHFSDKIAWSYIMNPPISLFIDEPEDELEAFCKKATSATLAPIKMSAPLWTPRAVSTNPADMDLSKLSQDALESLDRRVRGQLKLRRADARAAAKEAAREARQLERQEAAAARLEAAAKVRAAQPKYVKTILQLKVTGALLERLEWASTPAKLAESLCVPVGSVKSYLRRLRQSQVLVVTSDAGALCFSYEAGPEWGRWKSEYQATQSTNGV